MKLAIGILTYNHPQISLRCAQSAALICAQLPHLETEIFVLHNGSLEKNSRELQSTLEQQFPEIKNFFIKENNGYSGGANQCLRLAFEKLSADWFLLLTNDTQLLQFNPNILNQSPNLVFSPRILARKSERIDSLGGVFNPLTAHLKHIKEKNYKLRADEHFYIPGSSFLIHKKVFSSNVLFNQNYHTYWEDVEWSMRLVQAGFSLVSTDEIKLTHQIGKTCHKNSFYTLFLYQRNRLITSLNYSPRPFYTGALIAWSWLTLSVRLIRQGRWKDLRFLHSAKYFNSRKRHLFFKPQPYEIFL